MNVTIHAVNFQVTRAVRELVEKRLRFALRRYGDNLHSIIVRLSDGSSYGAIRCQVQARITGKGDVIIDHTDRNLHAAIYRSVERVSTAIVRRLKRKQAMDRQRQALPLPAS